MKKRILLLLLALILTLLCSCQHEHYYNDGYSYDEVNHWHNCSGCGEKADLAEHTWDEGTVTTRPTEEAEGEKTFTCTVCGATKAEKLDKLEPDHTHDYTIAGKDDTYHWNECVCGAKQDQEAHVWGEGEIVKQPTVSEAGLRRFTCTCGATKDEQIDKLPQHTHTYSDSWTKDADYHWHAATCEHTTEISGKQAHSWGDGALVKAPTTTEKGAIKYTCTVCYYEYEKEIPAVAADGLSFTADSLRKVDKLLTAIPLTIEAEVYLAESYTERAGVIFGNYAGTKKNFSFEVQAGGVPRLYYTDTENADKSFLFSDVDIRTGDWAHVAITFDFSTKTISFYLNGALVQEVTCTNDMISSIPEVAFVLGGDNRSGNAQYFKGQIRSLTAYSTVKTAAEIKSDYEKSVDPTADDVILHYYLSSADAQKDIFDYSGNGNNIPVEWFTGEKVELDYAYSFAVIGDTQVLAQNYQGKMEAIYDWIIANKDAKKIAHVFGLGDITEEWGNEKSEAEWINAQKYISKLDGVLPYSLVRGNHDETNFFNKYFANETYMGQFDGFMTEGDIRNSYKTFEVGSTKYMLVTLDYGASDEELAWANGVVAAHPEHKVIVTTHAYMFRDGTTLSRGDVAIPNDSSDVDDSPLKLYNDGQQIWEKFVSQHPNIVLVMSGHDPCEDVVTLQSQGVHGNVVTQMLIDPQGMDKAKGGLGMVCMLYFTADGSQMEVEWYSTDKDQYYKSKNQYTIDLSGAANDSHEFKAAYDQWHHYSACDCGYSYGKVAHTFDGGTLNTDGTTTYKCACGYTKVEPTKCTTTFITIDGVVLGVANTAASADGLYYITAPTYDGYVAEYDRIVVNADHDSLDNVIYYSPISVWDGSSVSTGLSGSGTEADPYLIQRAADFAYLRTDSFIGKHFKLTVSINLAGNAFTITSFDGILDGNHCSIRGINISATTDNTGLFGTLGSNSCVSDLSLYGTVAGAKYTGALAGIGKGEINNVVNYATVSGAGNLGGIVGNAQNTSYVINCKNYGAVNGTSWNNGGVVGFAQGPVISCTNYGNISTTGDCLGGVVGTSQSFVLNCINYGTLNAPGRAGGIVYNSNKLIEGCINYGSLTGKWDLGGILGYVAANNPATVKNCINNGIVTGTTGIGGIFGFTADGAKLTILDCVNNGEVNSNNWGAGGIAGNVNVNTVIEGCVNNGTVKAVGEVGGIVGKCSGKVTGCVNNGKVVGTQDIIGGIVGHLEFTLYLDVINDTNSQKGTVEGPNSQQIIGKAEVEAEEEATGPLTVEEFNAQPSMWGSPWVSNNTRMKILVQLRMAKGTKITFLGDTSVYRWGVMETTDKENATKGAYTDAGWNTTWTDPLTYTTTYATGYFVLTVSKPDNSALTQTELDNIHSMFKVEGNKATLADGGAANKVTLNETMVSINHRGWYEAPENTLSAYRKSKEHGFKYVECDVQFTKDGIPVLLHDDTIDRTSNGSGNVADYTYEQLLAYDFSYDDNDTEHDFSAYRGEKIPSFAEFIALCKELELHPYIEIKGSITNEEATALVKIVTDAGMIDSVSWLSFDGGALSKIVSLDPGARIVWVLTDTNADKIEATNIPFAQANLMTGESEVVFDLYYTLATQAVADLLKANNIPLEVWTVNDESAILNLNSYVSGVSSDKLIAKDILGK